MPGRRVRTLPHAVVGACLTLLLSACVVSGLLGPDEILGEYGAVAVNGRALPAYVNHDGSELSGRLLTAATLRLAAPSTMELALELRTVTSDGAVVALLEDTLVVDYALDGTILTMSPTDDAASFEVTDPGLVLEDGSLLVIVRFPYPPVTGYDGTYPADLVFAQ